MAGKRSRKKPARAATSKKARKPAKPKAAKPKTAKPALPLAAWPPADDVGQISHGFRALRELSQFLLRQLDSDGPADSRTDDGGFHRSATNAPGKRLDDYETLETFLERAHAVDLNDRERLVVIDGAIRLLEGVYVHLLFKQRMHGIDPVQRLRLMADRVKKGVKSPQGFHVEMLEIFNSLRDLHTNYVLPGVYQEATAFLPFLVGECFEGQDRARPIYLVTAVHSDFRVPEFKLGTQILQWNGVPIQRAVERNAHREAGSNLEARRARGLERLTIRPMGFSAPPDERWVVVGYGDETSPREVRVPWRVTAPPPSLTVDHLAAKTSMSSTLGIDFHAEGIRRAKKTLFFTTAMKHERAMSTRSRGRAAATSAATMETAEDVSLMPEVFRFRSLDGKAGPVGYVRIYTFLVNDAEQMVGEFVRIVRLLNKERLIIDVRGNGGGNLLAGQRLLEVLSGRPVAHAPLHFINTPVTQKLCEKGTKFDLGRWIESINLSTRTGDRYSQGFTLGESPDVAPVRVPGMPRKLLLIVDALSYSTTDMFAAGFQDHELGTILGTHESTGAGGANVWEYALVRSLLSDDFPELPKGVRMRAAIRRTVRVRARAGQAIEDLGVKPEEDWLPTRVDVTASYQDLLDHAVKLIERDGT